MAKCFDNGGDLLTRHLADLFELFSGEGHGGSGGEMVRQDKVAFKTTSRQPPPQHFFWGLLPGSYTSTEIKGVVMSRAAVACVALLGLVGCRNPEVVQISPTVYMLSAEDKGGAFGNSAKMKANVIRRAQEFAEARGKVAIPVSSRETPMHFGHFATFEYQFRLVDPNSPEAQGVTVLGPVPNVNINKNINKTEHTNLDVYAELERLDDLRKKGVLTEAEYEAEKKRVLLRQ